MSILEIELTPETTRRLAEKAKRRGLDIKAYAEEIMIHDVQKGAVAIPEGEKRYNVMDFYGIGRDAWAGIDVQQYINEMRDQWGR